MLAFFRTTQSFAGLPLLAYVLLVQLPYLLAGEGAEVTGSDFGPFGDALVAWSAQHPYLSAGLTVFLVATVGLQLNVLATRHRFARVMTQFPGLFAVLLLLLVPGARTLHPVHCAGVALGFALLSTGRVYKREEPAVPIFNAGAWVAVAALFVPAFLIFLVPAWVGISILGRLSGRNLLRTLVGVLIVFFLAFTADYVLFGGSDFWYRLLPGFSVYFAGGVTTVGAIGLGVVALLLGVVILSQNTLVRTLNIEGKKGVNFLYWVLLTTPLAALLWGGVYPVAAAAAALLVGSLLGLRLLQAPPARAEFIHLILFVLAFLPGILLFLG